MKGWQITIPGLGFALVCLGIIWLVNSCMEQDHAFRMRCVDKGGTLMQQGSTPFCISGGQRVERP